MRISDWSSDVCSSDLRGLREALENPARVDGLFIASATAKLTDNLSIMATEENLTAEAQYNPNAVDALFEALGRINDAIVVDRPRSSYSVCRRVFAAAPAIMLGTETTLSGQRCVLRDRRAGVSGIWGSLRE